MPESNKIRNDNSSPINLDDWPDEDFDLEDGSEGVEDGYGRSHYSKGDEADSTTPVTASDAVSQLEDLIQQTNADHSLSPENRKEINALKSKLNALHNKPIPENLLSEFRALQASILGNVAGDESEGSDGTGSLKQAIQDYKKTLEKTPNLDDQEKKSYLAQLDKWTSALNLKTADLEDIQSQFETVQQEVNTASTYPQAIRKLAKITGKEPSELQTLFKKHDLDPSNLPSPPDSKIAALLNDSDFSEKLGSLRESIASTTKDLKDEISKQAKTAHDLNDAAQQAKDKQRSSDDSSYKFLYNATFHQDEKSKALVVARTALAGETAKYLSALYGKEVKAETKDPEKSGFISFDQGVSLNVVGNIGSAPAGEENAASAQAQIQFSKKKIDWPPVEIVKFEVDLYGGKWSDDDGSITKIPEWMKQANYPMQAYDVRETAWWEKALLGIGSVGAGPLQLIGLPLALLDIADKDAAAKNQKDTLENKGNSGMTNIGAT